MNDCRIGEKRSSEFKLTLSERGRGQPMHPSQNALSASEIIKYIKIIEFRDSYPEY